MEKKFIVILTITFSTLLIFVLNKANSKDLKTNQAEKFVSAAEAGFNSFITHNLAVAEQKQPVQQSSDKGVGPVKEIKLEPINQKLANEGKSIFNSKCVVCHSLDQKVVGPPLRSVTQRRTPEYIMNMLLNPQNMEINDPITKDLHKKYLMIPMTDQQFTQAQARSVLEYLRTVVK